MRYIVFIFLIAIAITACEETFETPLKSLLGITLKYTLSSDTETPIVTTQGVDNDSILLNRLSANNFYLQLSHGESTSYAIKFDTISDADTITFFHEVILAHESMASGFFFEYILKDTVAFTRTRIDTVIIQSDTITQIRNAEHVTIYLNSPPVVETGNNSGDDNTGGE